MPIYSLTHCRAITAETKQELASAITKVHCEATGAPAKYVQVIFRQVEAGAAFTAGKRNDDFLCIEAQIRPGRSEEVEEKILWQLNDLMTRTFQPEKWFISLGRFNSPHLIENGELLPAAMSNYCD